MIKQKAELTYMAFFTVGSMLLDPLLHIPLMIGFLPSFLNSPYWMQELLFLLTVTGIPLVVLYAFYRFAKTIKNQRVFFTLTFLLLAGVSYFNFTITPALDNPGNAIRLLFVGVVLGLFISAVLTHFWRQIFVLKKTSEARLLKVPLLLILGILVVEWLMLVTTGNNLLLEVYVAVGEFIKPMINIFYLDLYGFVGLLLSLIASLVASAGSLLSKKS